MRGYLGATFASLAIRNYRLFFVGHLLSHTGTWMQKLAQGWLVLDLTDYAWQFAKAQYTADLGGWTRFVSMQNHYNLLYREDERELIPFCLDQGVGLIPFSPLARGKLARPWDDTTTRAANDPTLHSRYGDQDRPAVDRVLSVAQTHGVSQGQVALAWLMAQPGVTSPIVGVTRPEQITELAGASGVSLTQEELDELGAEYVPHRVSGPR